MVSCFSELDEDLLTLSYGTLLVCNYQGDASREVVDVKDFISSVAMVPLPMTEEEAAEPDAESRYGSRYFVVEKMGLLIAQLTGYREAEQEDGDGDGDEEVLT